MQYQMPQENKADPSSAPVSSSDQPGPEKPVSKSADAKLPVGALAPLETLQRTIGQSGARIVAFTSPRNGLATGVICAMLCRQIAASDIATILLDASEAGQAATGDQTWSPGEPVPAGAITTNVSGHGYDRLMISPTPETRPLFNNISRLKQAFENNFAAYENVIIHLPPILEAGANVVNPVSVSRASDAVFLVCGTDLTTAADAQQAAEVLKSAEVAVAGTVLDSTKAQSPGMEMARIVDNLWLLPGAMRNRLSKYLRKSALLNN